MEPTALRDLICAEPIEPPRISELLDGLTHEQRWRQIDRVRGVKLQGRLFRALETAPAVKLDELVPPELPPLTEQIFFGKNSLPAFTHFQKRFCRPPPGEGSGELWGFNRQTWTWLTGPGYFVVRVHPEHGAEIDYRGLPKEICPGWPKLTPNNRGISRLVYMGMVDRLRRVSRHVFIGAAYKFGRSIDNYFFMCRQ